ncbi:hypothetical protein BRC83_10250 [Halobacteriales archaeon QS_1_68_17]|nr:MAG: hypothetical protein BRC83_10250 [Halobacteriales archaeon QS_1_68_17]
MTDTTSLDGRTVVVTGGAGFIGSHIADRLVGNNEVRVVDDLSTGDRGNVPAGAEFVRKSITELETEDFAGADVVFHEAANVAVQRSVEDPEFDARSNVLGLIRPSGPASTGS